MSLKEKTQALFAEKFGYPVPAMLSRPLTALT